MSDELKIDTSVDKPSPITRVPAFFYPAISLYFGVPTVFGLAFGFTQAGIIAPLLHKSVSIIYWVTLLVALWLLLEACSRLAARLLRPIDSPLWLILIVGGLIQTPLGSLYLMGQQRFFSYFLTDTAFLSPFEFDGIGAFLTALPRLLLQNTGPIAIWVFTNYFFARVVGFPRFRKSQASIVTASTNPTHGDDVTVPAPFFGDTGLLVRLPENIRGEILVISAMDHYLQITTGKGSTLVHGRLIDAIREMPEAQGWQVHRSHWVHRAAIRRVITDHRRFRMELANGTVIPVSPRYIEVLKRAGFRPQHPPPTGLLKPIKN